MRKIVLLKEACEACGKLVDVKAEVILDGEQIVHAFYHMPHILCEDCAHTAVKKRVRDAVTRELFRRGFRVVKEVSEAQYFSLPGSNRLVRVATHASREHSGECFFLAIDAYFREASAIVRFEDEAVEAGAKAEAWAKMQE